MHSTLTKQDTAIIEIQHFSKSFGSNNVLDDVSIQFPREKISSILGRSGEGKSVLLKSVVGLIEPDNGDILYNGSSLLTSTHRYSHPDIGYLFQHAALFDSMTVFENIAFPIVETRQAISRKKLKEQVFQVLEWVGLSQAADLYPVELSGGMQKRVAIARTIIVYPKVLLFDEPTTGLDPTIARMIVELINRINKELRITCIIITHDVTAALAVSDFIAFLSGSKVRCQGEAQDIQNSELLELQTLLADATIKDGLR